ncbi:polysaccharide deacetylase [Paenibacillus mesophilus]|uniref:polysaccharide deacetylase family protein n=1 Tax=Paenibacillus mesophilus TaxID=2582849 RepID=UPI00110DD41F|nr:polysaccharide deacetylase family protein [Paenibacillus mesophilus]TMV51423.1 polysaccharide deacetylase [Paenibacillus mesophilus]
MTKVLMTFPQGKFKVLTLSYDDGRNADRRLVEVMNRYGIKGTFHLNSGLLGAHDRVPREDIAELFRGHEISAHTVNHPTIARCPKEQIVQEIMEDRKELESIAGYTVRGMSYPNGSFNKAIKEMLPMLGIEYSRVTESTGGFGMPDDWHEWKPTCHHNRNLLNLTENFLNINKSQNLYMMYVWGHSYEFDNDNSWALIETFCARAGGRDDIWYATNIEIVDYIKSFHRLQFSASRSFVYNPSASPVWIQANGKIVEIGGGSQVQLS